MKYEKLDISIVNRGEAIAQVNHYLSEAIKDALDPNKPPDKPRIITLELKIVADDDRTKAVIEHTVKTKFPPDYPGSDMIQIIRKNKTGVLVTSEQIDLDFDQETGEVQRYPEYIIHPERGAK